MRISMLAAALSAALGAALVTPVSALPAGPAPLAVAAPVERVADNDARVDRLERQVERRRMMERRSMRGRSMRRGRMDRRMMNRRMMRDRM